MNHIVVDRKDSIMLSTATEAPKLPSPDELSDAWTKLVDVQDDVLEPIMQSVFKALNYTGEQTITYERIGRLGAWATDIETTLDNLQRLAKNMQEAVLHDLPPIAMSG